MTLLLSAALAAATALTPPDGAEIPANWRELAAQEIQSRLKDPYSAVIRLSRGPRYTDFKAGADPTIGWAVCYSINAKNSYGGYAGAETYLVIVTAAGEARMMTDDGLVSSYAKAVVLDQVRKECAKPPGQPSTPSNPKAAI